MISIYALRALVLHNVCAEELFLEVSGEENDSNHLQKLGRYGESIICRYLVLLMTVKT